MSVIDEIKQKVDIVDVISEYVPLQKAGQNFRALCPFHAEKHPSFFVFPERQSWRCFGACAAGGDVFSFVMKKENLDFGQALRFFADRAGISLSPQPAAESEDKERARLWEINEVAAEYYHTLLLSSRSGEEARNYLLRRDIPSQSIQDFQLGFSPDNWEALRQYLLGKGYEEAELVAAGLAVAREEGGSYDRFRGRLMFPIRSIRGRVIGFGARALDDSLPKYLNSPQTAIFDKSGCLYGIDRAQAAIRRHNLAVVVEGYMDVIRAHQYGFDNVVASLGTAITEKQVSMLKRLTANVSLALDADAAGREATLRGAEVANRALEKKVTPILNWRGWVKYEDTLNAELRVIALPQGKDPDDVIKEDTQLWQHLVEEASPMVDYAIEVTAARFDVTKARDKSLAVEQLLPLVFEIKDPLRQSHYLQKLARVVRVNEHTLEGMWRRFQPTKQMRYNKHGEKSEFPSMALALSLSSPLEEYCLALLFQYPELRAHCEGLSSEYFQYSESRELFIRWQGTPVPVELRGSLDSALQEHLERILKQVIPPIAEKERERVLAHCILRLRERWLKDLEASKKETLAAAAESGGVAGELDQLEELGKEASEQLQEVFLKEKRMMGKRCIER